MRRGKKILWVVFISFILFLDVLICINIYFFRSAEKEKNAEKKIRILEKANKFYPLNDLIYWEIGKNYYELGLEKLEDRIRGEQYFSKSIHNFRKSIKLNPASYFVHFNLAHALFYRSILNPSLKDDFLEEYKKTILLAGQNDEIYYEVGKFLFSQWPKLSEDDRKFTLDVCKRIDFLRERERLRTFLNIWDLNIKDYKVIRKIIPESPQVYREYAQFLGEKALSLKERQEILALADFLEFEKAKKDFQLGEKEFYYYRYKKAGAYFDSCLKRLERIKFYQKLTHQSLISLAEFNEIRKFSLLNLAKCRIEEGDDFQGVENLLRRFLWHEEKVGEINKLEDYLIRRGLLNEDLTSDFEDLNKLSFKLFLYFKQSRYTDILKAGNIFQRSFYLISEDRKGKIVEVLTYFGDSCQKMDRLFDAEEFYKKALELEPDNLEVLLRIRKTYERLNEEMKIKEVERRIEKILTPKEAFSGDSMIYRGKVFNFRLMLDGRRGTLNLQFKEDCCRDMTPVITVFFNGEIIWEDSLKAPFLSVSFDSNIGMNTVEVESLGFPVSLLKLTYE